MSIFLSWLYFLILVMILNSTPLWEETFTDDIMSKGLDGIQWRSLQEVFEWIYTPSWISDFIPKIFIWCVLQKLVNKWKVESYLADIEDLDECSRNEMDMISVSEEVERILLEKPWKELRLYRRKSS